MNNIKLVSGHTAVELEGEELRSQERDFGGYTRGLIRLQPGGWFFPKAFTAFADRYYNFLWKPSDVCIMTYAKCGTTWMQEIIWSMRNNPNLDNPMHKEPLFVRSPFLDLDMIMAGTELPGDVNPSDSPLMKSFEKLCPGKKVENGMMLQLADAITEPRTIKTHLSFSLLSPDILEKTKIVFVARNPKDVIVSYHHHHHLFRGLNYKGTFEEFVKYFVTDDLMYSPYWLMMKEAWERRTDPNMHMVFFEDLQADLKGELRKLDTFLGTGLTSKQLDNVCEWTSFKSMKGRDVLENQYSDGFTNQDVSKNDGGFFRKGTTGNWKDKFTPELEKLVDDWTQKHLGDLGVNYKYSI